MRDALRGQTGIGALETVEVCSAEDGGALVTVALRVPEGVNARQAAFRATDRLQERLPAAEIRVHVLGGST